MKNYVLLIGNLGQDPELKILESGKKIARFTLATSDHYKDSEGNKIAETTWHNVVAWNSLADIAIKYLKKGTLTVVEGKISYRSYEDMKGNTKYITEIVASNINFIKKP